MAHADFVHLRVHTAFSLSEGAIHINELAELCGRHDMPAVAITDTNNLFGSLQFSNTMAAAGVQPIVGCTLGLMVGKPGDSTGQKAVAEPIVLLTQNETGYRNLMKLVSHAHLGTDGVQPPHVTLDELRADAGGLIALTGGPGGPVGARILDGQMEEAERLLRELAEIFPGRLYVEILRHGMGEESATEAAFLDFAYDHDLPLVATNEAYFVDESMFSAQDALLCIADSVYVGQQDRRRLTSDHRFKSAAEMKALFTDLPEAIGNTLVIARRCGFGVQFHAPILPKFPANDGLSEADQLRKQANAGLEARLKVALPDDLDDAARAEATKPYRERLEKELGIIIEMDFPGYFLIVADFIRWAKKNDVPVGPGRGSGAGSVVAWALTITDLDPLRFGLLFERFLNPERVSMPDFDIDFCQDKRDRVIRYVQEKYGSTRVAQIITFGKLKARAVMRDVGRVLEMPHGQVDRLCKMVPNNPANPVTLSEALENEPRLQDERDTDASVARMLDIALRLEGMFRHTSTHAAGVVIGDRPLDELVPLYSDPRSDLPVTQFDMKWVEKAGLVKFDFLGLKTLTVIDHAVKLIRDRGIEIDIATLPLDDRPTYELLSHGDSVGIFQLEGSGMRDVLRQLKPDAFEDIIALVALYRPGPMDNIPTYIKRKHGEEKPDYLHQTLTDILKETNGVIIYQEQVMQIAQVLAGYSLGEADLLRRAMGKKIAAEMDAQRERFVSGAVEKGVEKKQASFIFDLVAKFAGYGFNKSHAAAYALVAYQTAWLKANYPVEFMAALMTLDLGNTDKLAIFAAELERLEIRLLPPDVNYSFAGFAVESDQQTYAERGDCGTEPALCVRYAMAAIKNVGKQAIEMLVEERAINGRFKDMIDFAERVDPRAINKRLMENLIKAGAFDSMAANRAQTYDSIEMLLRHAVSVTAERASQQTNLFGGDAAVHDRPNLPDVPDWQSIDKLEREREAIGFYLSGHPLDGYAQTLEKQGIVAAAEVMARVAKGASRFKLAGVVSKFQERKSARGNPYAFATLSDASGGFEVTLFSEVLNASRELLDANQAVIVTVEASLSDDTLKMIGQRIQSLDQVVTDSAAGLKIFIDSEKTLAGIKRILDKCPGRKGSVAFVVNLDEGRREVEIALPGRYAISPKVRDAITTIPGVVDTREM